MFFQGYVDDFWGQVVVVFEVVWYQVIDLGCVEYVQGQYVDVVGGGVVGVEVVDDENLLVVFQGVYQQCYVFFDVFQLLVGNQLCQVFVQFFGVMYVMSCVQVCQ